MSIHFKGQKHPKVNVYEYDDKVGVVLRDTFLDKKDLTVEVEDGVLTISGDKHGLFDDSGKVIRRELKHSSFARSFELGELLDGENIKDLSRMVYYLLRFLKLNLNFQREQK